MVATRSDSQTRNTTKLHAAISSYFSGITSNLPKEQRNIAEKIMDLANAEHYNRAHVLSKRYKICPASYDRYDMFPIEKFRASIQKKSMQLLAQKRSSEFADLLLPLTLHCL